jgi:hypothetical protein
MFIVDNHVVMIKKDVVNVFKFTEKTVFMCCRLVIVGQTKSVK